MVRGGWSAGVAVCGGDGVLYCCGKVVVWCGFGEGWWGGDGGTMGIIGGGGTFICVWEEKGLGGGDGGCFGCLDCGGGGRSMPSILISVCLQGLSFDALNQGPNCWSSNWSVS